MFVESNTVGMGLIYVILRYRERLKDDIVRGRGVMKVVPRYRYGSIETVCDEDKGVLDDNLWKSLSFRLKKRRGDLVGYELLGIDKICDL